jgi:U3 small nucleolar RNA-associated protein 18
MPKNARKRQKTSEAKGDHDFYAEPLPSKAARLEMLLDEESKDDEERKLESLLFGVKYIPKGEDIITNHDENEGSSDELDDQGGRGLQHLLDQDVCLLIYPSPRNNTNSTLLFIISRFFL